ncbi:MAG: hypothetical protein ACK55I_13745, partial [bacterium]
MHGAKEAAVVEVQVRRLRGLRHNSNVEPTLPALLLKKCFIGGCFVRGCTVLLNINRARVMPIPKLFPPHFFSNCWKNFRLQQVSVHFRRDAHVNLVHVSAFVV